MYDFLEIGERCDKIDDVDNTYKKLVRNSL